MGLLGAPVGRRGPGKLACDASRRAASRDARATPLCYGREMAARSIGWPEVDALEQRLRRELPRFEVRYKAEWRLQRLIGRLVWPFNRQYMTAYTTVMGGRVYFPSRAWREQAGPARLYKTLRHEAVHLRDMRRFPGFFQLSYLLLLPAGLTFRALWEWRAYRETLRAELEVEGTISDALLAHVEERFCGPDYLYMLPLRRTVRRWLHECRQELTAVR